MTMPDGSRGNPLLRWWRSYRGSAINHRGIGYYNKGAYARAIAEYAGRTITHGTFGWGTAAPPQSGAVAVTP